MLGIACSHETLRLNIDVLQAIFNKFDVDSSGNIDFLECVILFANTLLLAVCAGSSSSTAGGLLLRRYLLCVDSLNEFFPELVNTFVYRHRPPVLSATLPFCSSKTTTTV